MPNGHSGSFTLNTVEFERLLKQHNGDTVLGTRTKPHEPVTAEEMMTILRVWKHDEVMIEEQDGTWYIVHFPEWVSVNDRSPLFRSLRQAHTEFLKNSAKGQRKDGEAG